MNAKVGVSTILIATFLITASQTHAQRGVGDAVGIARQGSQANLITIEGTLKAIKTGPCENTTGRAMTGTHLIISVDDGVANVHLGPTKETQAIVKQLKDGQLLVVEAFRADKHPAGHYVATRIKLAGKFVALRDNSLRPSWAQKNDDVTRRRNQLGSTRMRRGRGPHRRGMGFQSLGTSEDNSKLNDELRESILHMREEEKLARDVYLTLSEKYGVPIFSRIAAAETRHMAAIKTVIDSYGLTDPLVDDSRGVFAKSEFNVLYKDLVATGSESLEKAYQVGALIEELDISDLADGMSRVGEHPNIEWVFQNLMRGSRNHLRMFDFQLSATGQRYHAKHLSQQEYDRIAMSSMERGNGRRSMR